MVVGGIYAFTGIEVVSLDLQAALGAFVVGALTRFRLSRPRKAQKPSEDAAPSEAAPDDVTPPAGSQEGDG